MRRGAHCSRLSLRVCFVCLFAQQLNSGIRPRQIVRVSRQKDEREAGGIGKTLAARGHRFQSRSAKYLAANKTTFVSLPCKMNIWLARFVNIHSRQER